jgi:signal transduction histidine kinase
MRPYSTTLPAGAGNMHLVLAYLTDLELEVDRLRKQGAFLRHQVRDTLRRVQLLCEDTAVMGETLPPLGEIGLAVRQLGTILHDMHEPPGYHPAHDQVIAIAVRPLIEQVFRWQQRLVDVPQAVLRLDLESDSVEWFPARLRHILENLISNALKYRDPAKVETWVAVSFREVPAGYEFRVSDNGVGLPLREQQQVASLFYRAAPVRAAGLEVGLAVVKLLVEQSGGTLAAGSEEGQGTTFVVSLPRFAMDDYLTSSP